MAWVSAAQNFYQYFKWAVCQPDKPVLQTLPPSLFSLRLQGGLNDLLVFVQELFSTVRMKQDIEENKTLLGG